MPRRISQEKADEIRDAYMRWSETMYSAESITVDQLAAQLGVSKPTIYDLRNKGWQVNGWQRPAGTRAAVAHLETQHHELATKVSELSLRVAELTRMVEDLAARG